MSGGTRTMWSVSHPSLTGIELFEFNDTGEEAKLRGWVVASVEGIPCAVSYEIATDRRWVTRRVRVRLDSEPSQTLELDHDGRGAWLVNGENRPDLSTCLDVDLGISPSTNTLPIRRLALEVGAAETLDAAWVRFPDLTVDVLSQRYERRGESVYRYSSASFQRDLDVDERGVVRHYGDDLWQTVDR